MSIQTTINIMTLPVQDIGEPGYDKYVMEDNVSKFITEQKIAENTELVNKIKTARPGVPMSQEQALEWLRTISAN